MSKRRIRWAKRHKQGKFHYGATAKPKAKPTPQKRVPIAHVHQTRLEKLLHAAFALEAVRDPLATYDDLVARANERVVSHMDIK